MKILLSPQVREDSNIWYEIENQKITATINDVSDTFDFTDMPDGELELYDDEGNELIETKLEEVPILGAEKRDGVLTVEILFSISPDEDDMRLLFPQPLRLEDFYVLMDELHEKNIVRKEKERREEEENLFSEEPVINRDFETVSQETEYPLEYLDIEGVDF